MKNFILQGDTLDVVMPSNVVSGQLVILAGPLIGVATTTALAGATAAIKTTGVFEFAKNAAEAWVVGSKVYWDATSLVATVTSGTNQIVGRVAEPAANPSAVGRVLLSRLGV